MAEPAQIIIEFIEDVDPETYAGVFHRVWALLSIIGNFPAVTLIADGTTATSDQMEHALDALVETVVARNPHGW